MLAGEQFDSLAPRGQKGAAVHVIQWARRVLRSHRTRVGVRHRGIEDALCERDHHGGAAEAVPDLFRCCRCCCCCGRPLLFATLRVLLLLARFNSFRERREGGPNDDGWVQPGEAVDHLLEHKAIHRPL